MCGAVSRWPAGGVERTRRSYAGAMQRADQRANLAERLVTRDPERAAACLRAGGLGGHPDRDGLRARRRHSTAGRRLPDLRGEGPARRPSADRAPGVRRRAGAMGFGDPTGRRHARRCVLARTAHDAAPPIRPGARRGHGRARHRWPARAGASADEAACSNCSATGVWRRRRPTATARSARRPPTTCSTTSASCSTPSVT